MMLEGGNADKIDQALVEFGMPMGPVELADQIGLDVMYDASGAVGMPAIVEAKLKEMVDAGTIGRKSGSGFYTWVEMKADRPRKIYDPAELSEIAEILLAPMVRECQAVVDEGIVESMDHADAAMIFGIGYPAFRGGPLFYTAQKQN
jgi:3-hydroxyacyl-CoA dehydrogenase/enoyl-CoA hydratase/3-hydroxybutyryl-CoA epimerase